MRWKPWKCKDCMRPADGQSRPGVLNWIHLKSRFPQQSWFCNMAGSRQEAETTWNKIRCGTLCAKTKRKTARAKISSTISTQTLLKPSKTKTLYHASAWKYGECRHVNTIEETFCVCMWCMCVCEVPTYIYYIHTKYNIIYIYIYMCVSPGCYEWNYIYTYIQYHTVLLIVSFSTLRNGLGLRDG